MTHHDERCPNCASNESTIPLVTIDGTTLWECIDDSCSGGRWRTDAPHEGLNEDPSPRAVERILDGAAAYRDEGSLQALTDDIARLYRHSRTGDDGRDATRVPCPR